MIAGLRDRGWRVDVRELDPSFPHPTPAARHDAARQLATIPDGTYVMIDGLALGSLPAEVEREAPRLKVVALVHMPLADAIGLDRETAACLAASERRCAEGGPEVAPDFGPLVTHFAKLNRVCREELELRAPGDGAGDLTSEGGAGQAGFTGGAIRSRQDAVRALEAVPSRDWLLTCAGSLDRDPSTAERLRARIRAGGLDDRVSLAGELDGNALEICYHSADVFVLATLHETYCMAVAEALAHGLPIVSTKTGAIPELVGEGRNGEKSAGLLVPPGDVGAMTAALEKLFGDARVREELAEGARRVRDRLPTWNEAVDKMAAALNDVA